MTLPVKNKSHNTSGPKNLPHTAFSTSPKLPPNCQAFRTTPKNKTISTNTMPSTTKLGIYFPTNLETDKPNRVKWSKKKSLTSWREKLQSPKRNLLLRMRIKIGIWTLSWTRLFRQNRSILMELIPSSSPKLKNCKKLSTKILYCHILRASRGIFCSDMVWPLMTSKSDNWALLTTFHTTKKWSRKYKLTHFTSLDCPAPLNISTETRCSIKTTRKLFPTSVPNKCCMTQK